MHRNFGAIVLFIVLSACAAPAPPTPTSVPVAPTSVPTIASPTNTPVPTLNPRTANIKEIVNKVDARNTQAQNFDAATLGQSLNVGGQARTGENSKARLDFTEGTIIRLGPSTILSVEDLTANSGSPLTRFQLELGKLWIALKGGTLDVKTPAGIVSVRGSYTILEVFADGSVRVAHLEGVAVHVPTNTVLGNLKGLVLMRDGTIADRFDVPPTFLMDFCDNNMESCPTLLNLLGIRSLENVRELIDKNPPSKENPKCRPSRTGGC